jgi:hypothetical protein
MASQPTALWPQSRIFSKIGPDGQRGQLVHPSQTTNLESGLRDLV